jgi:hypothetical protein
MTLTNNTNTGQELASGGAGRQVITNYSEMGIQATHRLDAQQCCHMNCPPCPFALLLSLRSSQ